MACWWYGSWGWCVSYVELLILYELWAGERLTLEKAHPQYLGPGHPISVSAVPCDPGIDIWRSCRVIAAMIRSLCFLSGGLGRFVPCSIGANHCRLRQKGLERCGHGFTYRPRKSASEGFSDQLLLLFQYPPKSSRALLDGTLPLRFVLLGLQVGFLLGLCRCLVMLLLWFMQVLVPRLMVRLRSVMKGFIGLVILAGVVADTSSSELSAHQVARAGVAAHSSPSGERTELVDGNGHVWVRLDTVHGSFWKNLDTTRPGSRSCGGASDSVPRR